MSDLETRLTEALTEGSRGAPAAVGLATAARTRARARRRTRMAGVAAVVALAVGVPTAVVAARSGDDPARPPSDGTVATDPAAPDQGPPDGYHYESWHDVTIAVPDAWGYGPLDQWCADGGKADSSRVQRPGGAQTLMLCSPASGYGVSLAPSEGQHVEWPVAEQNSDSWPAGAYVGAVTVGNVVVTIVTADADVALQVLGSAQRNEARDPNGCPVVTGSDLVVPGDTMAVCRYDASGRLEQSELLTGSDKDAAEAALEAAPDATAMDCDAEPSQTVRLATEAEDAQIDLSCGSLTVRGEARALGSDVLYWALSPGWFGSVDGSVPLPTELRQR